ncbi:hypothetical protein DL768_005160 [Monosporascus sp. mg162]|nr:hypothetical protein DL768_005160 [Monosporascus sp. mg162]
MADPISTLSLVANVMQVIAFTGDFIRLCRTTLEDGTPEPGAASNAAHFAALLSTLRDNTSHFDPILAEGEGSNETLRARNRLKSLASDLARDTKELQGVLGKITTTASSGASHRLKAVLTYKFYYKGLIASLEKRIDGTRNVMSSEFLSRICSSTQAAHARLEERYTGLRDDMKLFIDRWSDGKRTISELVSAEAQATRMHVTSEAIQTRGRIDLLETRLVTGSSRYQAEETRRRVLSTLWFREMNERENTIEEASDDTVKWVFSEEPLANGEKCRFMEWLKSDQSVFWISGKPGSGKSTLMKFLLRDRRTTEYLETWKTPVQICRFKEHVDYLHVPDEAYQKFLSDIVRGSEGVFLWAVIAIKDLLRSMHNLDTWPMICKQLAEFPPSLNGLYKRMWKKQNEDWPRFKEEAAEIFWLILNFGYWGAFRALHCLIATHQELRKELLRLVTAHGYYSSEDEIRISETYEAWLSARSCGLVEIDPYPGTPSQVRLSEWLTAINGTAYGLFCIKSFATLHQLLWLTRADTESDRAREFAEEIKDYVKILDDHGSGKPGTRTVDIETVLGRCGERRYKDGIRDEFRSHYRVVLSVQTAWFSGLLDQLSKASGMNQLASIGGYDRSDLIRFSYIFSDQSPQEHLSPPSSYRESLAVAFSDDLRMFAIMGLDWTPSITEMISELYSAGHLQLFRPGQSQSQAQPVDLAEDGVD